MMFIWRILDQKKLYHRELDGVQEMVDGVEEGEEIEVDGMREMVDGVEEGENYVQEMVDGMQKIVDGVERKPTIV